MFLEVTPMKESVQMTEINCATLSADFDRFLVSCKFLDTIAIRLGQYAPKCPTSRLPVPVLNGHLVLQRITDRIYNTCRCPLSQLSRIFLRSSLFLLIRRLVFARPLQLQ